MHTPQFAPNNYVKPTSEDIIIIILSELLVFASQDCHTHRKLRTETCMAFHIAVREETYRPVDNLQRIAAWPQLPEFLSETTTEKTTFKTLRTSCQKFKVASSISSWSSTLSVTTVPPSASVSKKHSPSVSKNKVIYQKIKKIVNSFCQLKVMNSSSPQYFPLVKDHEVSLSVQGQQFCPFVQSHHLFSFVTNSQVFLIVTAEDHEVFPSVKDRYLFP